MEIIKNKTWVFAPHNAENLEPFFQVYFYVKTTDKRERKALIEAIDELKHTHNIPVYESKKSAQSPEVCVFFSISKPNTTNNINHTVEWFEWMFKLIEVSVRLSNDVEKLCKDFKPLMKEESNGNKDPETRCEECQESTSSKLA